QEIGRAGRDGLASDCILLYSWADVLSHARMDEMMEPLAADPSPARGGGFEKARAMFGLADAPGCRQQRLVAHFDETLAPCGTSCDACRGASVLELFRPVAPARVAAGDDRGTGARRRPQAGAGIDDAGGLAPADATLFARLRALRRALADAEGVPAYIVFSDAVLLRIATARPTDDAGLLAIPGVGPAKLARYGGAFLDAIRS